MLSAVIFYYSLSLLDPVVRSVEEADILIQVFMSALLKSSRRRKVLVVTSFQYSTNASKQACHKYLEIVPVSGWSSAPAQVVPILDRGSPFSKKIRLVARGSPW